MSDKKRVIHRCQAAAFAVALVVGTTWADESEESANTPSSWRESTIARCTQQFSAAQCQDENFLEENFHVSSLEAAHRISIKRNRLEEKALRELTLQRLCGMPTSATCSSSTDSAQCTAQLEQACAQLQADAYNCAQNALVTCADDTDPNNCYTYQIAYCPSLKKQPIELFLIKYPQLSGAQKSKLIATAAELDAQTNWWSKLVAVMKTPFR